MLTIQLTRPLRNETELRVFLRDIGRSLATDFMFKLLYYVLIPEDDLVDVRSVDRAID